MIYNFKNLQSLIYFCIIAGYIGVTDSFQQLMFFFIEIMLVMLLGQDVRDELHRKKTAQNLYDELRKKDEELIRDGLKI